MFSQRSAATKSSAKSGSGGSRSVQVLSGKSGGAGGIPRAALEGSAFVIPAQEVRQQLTRFFSDTFQCAA